MVLAADGKRLDEQLVEVVAVGRPLAQLVRPGPQAGVVERLELVLELVDGSRDRQMALDFPLVRVQELGQVQH